MDPKLTLATAVTRGRISETVKKQQSELKVLVELAAVDAEKNGRKPATWQPVPAKASIPAAQPVRRAGCDPTPLRQ